MGCNIKVRLWKVCVSFLSLTRGHSSSVYSELDILLDILLDCGSFTPESCSWDLRAEFPQSHSHPHSPQTKAGGLNICKTLLTAWWGTCSPPADAGPFFCSIHVRALTNLLLNLTKNVQHMYSTSECTPSSVTLQIRWTNILQENGAQTLQEAFSWLWFWLGVF